MLKKLIRRNVIANESYASDDKFVFKKIPKNKTSKSVIADALSNHFLFAGLDGRSAETLINAMEAYNCKQGTYVIKQGKQGNTFYVLEEGQCDVYLDNKKVAEIKAPAAFGELALKTLGKGGLLCSSFFTSLSCIIANAAHLSTVSQMLHDITSWYYTGSYDYPFESSKRAVTISILLVLVLPFCFSTSLRALRHISSIFSHTIFRPNCSSAFVRIPQDLSA